MSPLLVVGALVMVLGTAAAALWLGPRTVGRATSMAAGARPPTAAAAASDTAHAAASGPTDAPSATTTAPLPVHEITIKTRPKGATVTVVPLSDRDETVDGATPFTTTVPQGDVELRFALDDHEPRTERVTVDRDETFKWWLDPRGQLHHKIAEFDTGAAPKQVAFTPDASQVWVSLLGGPGVEVFDPTDGERLARVDLGDHGAVEVIFTADGDTAYASQMESGSVFEIDTATYEVRRQISTGGTWSKIMTLSDDERRMFVSNWVSNDVSEIDLDDGDVLRTIPSVTTPRGLYVDDDMLYVAGFDSGALQRIDLGDDDVDGDLLVSTGGAMRHLVGDPRRRLLYAGDMGVNAVFVHDLDGDRVDKLADTDHKPNTIDLGADGRVVYVSNRGANNPESYYLPGPEWGSVLAIDTATGEALDAIVGGNQTTGLDVSDDGRLLAFTDFLDDRVQIYEIPPYEALADGDGGRAGPHRRDLVKAGR